MAAGEALPALNPKIDRFFEVLEGQLMDVSFGDVLIAPLPTDIVADDAQLHTRFSRRIPLLAPFVSAAMDTITESPMAIAMAKAGGIGVIHGKMSTDDLRREARTVKLHMNGVIENPVHAFADQTVQALLEYCNKMGFEFRTFPVITRDGKLTGMFTQHNLDFWDRGSDQLVSDLMTNGGRLEAALDTTSIAQAYELMKTKQLKKLPLTDNSGELTAMYIWSDVQRLALGNPEQYNLDEAGRLRVAVAIPTHPDKAGEIVNRVGEYADAFVLDSSHGNGKEATQTIRHLRALFGDSIELVGGNVADGQSAVNLAKAGADAIKVGIGGGSICTTRNKTGIGRLQLSAVYETVSALREQGYDIPVISDGAIDHAGDPPKAFVAGAESVMMGGRLAATDETPGEIDTDARGTKTKIIRGMGSVAAQSSGPSARDYTSGDMKRSLFSEGVVARVELRGAVAAILEDNASGVRNAMAHINAPGITALRQVGQFRRMSPAGARESAPHIDEVGAIQGA